MELAVPKGELGRLNYFVGLQQINNHYFVLSLYYYDRSCAVEGRKHGGGGALWWRSRKEEGYAGRKGGFGRGRRVMESLVRQVDGSLDEAVCSEYEYGRWGLGPLIG